MQTLVTDELVYLRPDTMLEPLVDRWYAWSYLIPPVTAARNITHRHLQIIDSYLSAPHVHAAAVKNPKMLGGPFIDYDGGRLEEIRSLKQKTLQNCGGLIRLSSAVQELGDLLRSEAKGGSLHPLYPRIPEPLRGFVELVYDLNSQASFRLIEPLLYRSAFYMRSLQSLLLSTTSSDDRPFTLSTPRLDKDDAVHMEIPFEDVVVDFLAELKSRPVRLADVRDALPLDTRDIERFDAFLTRIAPPQYSSYTGRGARWRYFGHACILLETGSASFLFDPVISYSYQTSLHRYTYSDLPAVLDCVCITHNHQDHILMETLLQLRHRAKYIVVPKSAGSLEDPSLALILRAIGFRNVIELGEMEELQIGDIKLIGVPFFGEHADLNIRSKLAYLVHVGRHSLMFAADSCNIEPKVYEHVQKSVGHVDALFLGMECDGAPLSWLYGPLLTQQIDRMSDQSRRLSGSNYDQGIDIVRRFGCSEVYVYAMGQEPWLNYIMSIKYTDASNPIIQSNKLIEDCIAHGVRAERLFGEKEIFLDS